MLFNEDKNRLSDEHIKHLSDISDGAVPRDVRKGQPGYYCQWRPTPDGKYIEWDSGERFYDYVPWIKHLIKQYLEPWGYLVNGEVEWYGEERDDMGKIIVKDNKVRTQHGKIVFEDDTEPEGEVDHD